MSAKRSTRKRLGSLPPALGDHQKRNKFSNSFIPDEEDMSETLKLLHMTKEDKQSMSSYYQQLKEQAEQCGIQCCQDRVIRDRLIQAITEEAVLVEIGKMQSLTSAEVFAIYTEIVQEEQVFSAVLPYLSLADISVLTKTTRRLERIVRSYVKQGGNITIDNYVSSAYPLETNRNFYMQFKDASTLTLIRIAEGEVAGITSCFKQIKWFTMINMVILDNIKDFPQSLSELTLTKVQIEDPLFKEFILNSKDTLKALHLDQVLTNWVNTGDESHDLNDLCPKLISLVVKVPSSYMCWDKHLKVETQVFPKLIKNVPFQLENLYYDGSGELYIKDKKDLKYVTLKYIPEGVFPSAIEHLKMIKAHNYKYKFYFDDLNIKHLEIVYYNEPVTDTPGPNQILNTLNDDCLLKVSQYLSLNDRLSFAKSHPRIQQLVTRHGISTLEVDSRNLTVVTENRELWTEAFPYLKQLTVRNITNDDLLWMLRHCTGLKKFELFDTSFQRSLSHQLIRNSDQLKNVTEITVNSSIDLNFLLNLLHRNKDTLEVFKFYVHKHGDWTLFQDIWEVLAEMNYIKEVSIGKLRFVSSDGISQKTHVERILSLVGRKLKIFEMVFLDDCVDYLNISRLPQVQELSLHMSKEISEDNWSTLASLKHLQKLKISSLGELNHAHILQLVKSLPQLIELVINDFTYDFPLRFGVELKKYLLQENRFLRIIFQEVELEDE